MARYLGVLLTCLTLHFSLPSLAQETPAHATNGILIPVGTVDLQQRPLTQNSSVSTSSQSRPRGARPIPRVPSVFSALTKAPDVAPALLDAQPLTAQPAELSELQTNFNGVSSRDSAVTNFGAEFEPPDQGLCVGNGFVVEPVNSAFTIYRRDGSVVAGPFNVNVLFDEGLTQFTSDPRCFFDPATHTWFATILFINDTNTGARTDIAVNSSGDPTTPWTVYHLDATDDGTNGTPKHPGCPCFGDQPLLGIDGENIYVSTNEFSILGPQFNGAQVYAISKSDLISHESRVHFVHFENLTIGGTVATSVQPAITYDGHGAEYFLNSLDPSGTLDNRLGVWALTNQKAVSAGGTPTLSKLVVSSEVYGVPPSAIQQGSKSRLDSGDDRMQQVQFIEGELWGALGTVVTVSGDNAPRAGIAWFKIHPRLAEQGIGEADVSSQGYVASAGNYLLYPAIQANFEGSVAMVMTLSGPRFFASAAYTVLSDGASFGPVKIAAAGTGPYDRKATRWGDYSFAVLEPDGNGLWLATEYIPPIASQTQDGLRNWGTRVFEVNVR
jgi:hypothetical protein